MLANLGATRILKRTMTLLPDLLALGLTRSVRDKAEDFGRLMLAGWVHLIRVIRVLELFPLAQGRFR